MKKTFNLLFISIIVILFGYIAYTQWPSKSLKEDQLISDQATAGVADPSFVAAIAYDLPEKVSFAGEDVPMHVADVRERFDKELQINCYLHSNTLFLMKRAHRWLPQMKPILDRYNIPDDFKYLPLIESNLLNARSPKDAVGYWQILADSGREMGLEITNEVDERYDPLKATEAACKYLTKAYSKFEDWTLVAASYNRGRSGLQRAIDDQQENSFYDLYLNDETSRYVFRLAAIKEIMEHPATYGFIINESNLYKEEQLRYVEVSETIKDFVAFAKANGSNYKLLKLHNPWLRAEKLTVKKGKTYRIALPQ
ncbi:MAG TPA: lytic transglycosylase domain-containing protein [Chryseolinea sp.]|nr:lytic transglycosylase domain-containing protein [Chryseolinea sp.]HPM29875.1 lytic transglycosylase domain-containing protein [Chryseolinea sp.]